MEEDECEGGAGHLGRGRGALAGAVQEVAQHERVDGEVLIAVTQGLAKDDEVLNGQLFESGFFKEFVEKMLPTDPWMPVHLCTVGAIDSATEMITLEIMAARMPVTRASQKKADPESTLGGRKVRLQENNYTPNFPCMMIHSSRGTS